MLAPMRVEQRRLVLNGITTYAEDRGTGPALVIVHGWTAGRVLWRPHQRALCDHRRVVTYDLRGHGDAGKSESVAYTIPQFADDLRLLFDALEIEQASLLGHSMGGHICQEFALLHPHRVEKLVLSGSSMGHGDPNAPGAQDLLAMLRDGGYEDFIEFGADLWFHTAMPQETVDLVANTMRRCPAPVAAAALEGLVAWTSRDRIAALTMPALVIVGAEDTTQPMAEVRALADALPQGQLKMVEGAGHDCYLEAPEAYREIVRQFLCA